MYFKENKEVETFIYFDATSHEVITEVYFDKYEDPFISVSATPREMVQELIEGNEYTKDQLDMFLDTLYSAAELLENHLNNEDD